MAEDKKYNDMEIGVDPVLASPPDSFTADELYEYLCDFIRAYHPDMNLELVEKAYKLAEEAHEGQVRKSGEPYIIHPLRVAIILAALELDKETIVAGILHDVVEDTKYTYTDIESMFNTDVANLVDGVTKLGLLSIKKDKIEMQAENLRKMFLAMAKDIRVILIKLADRLHNMRTLQYMRREKQIEIAKETQDIYSPLAHRLGIFKIKVELDDLCLRYLEPEVYFDLLEKLNDREMFRHEYIANIIKDVKSNMEKNGIKCSVYGRVKHVFSIYKKIVKKKKSLDEIYDLFAVRIVVETKAECYAALGGIHAVYKTMSNRFKDYISVPKPNMYQSIHTTVFGNGSVPFEIQIRTKEMHRIAEYGIAAHWVYKEGGGNRAKLDDLDAKLSWLRQIIEMQQNTKDNQEFISVVKDDLNLFSDKVYIFTPEGDIKILKKGAITVDFAYSIHSAVGNKMVGARVNGKMVPIDYELKNSDIVEIITSNNSNGPSLDWLNKVATSQAKTKINQWFKSQNKEENIAKGKNIINNYCKLNNISFNNISKNKYIDKILARYNLKNWDSIVAAIGHGGLKESAVIGRLLEEYKKDVKVEVDNETIIDNINKNYATKKKSKPASIVSIKGVDDLDVRLPNCCKPIPGDEIVGYITRGRGITVHRTDCKNIVSMSEIDKMRLVDSEWNWNAINATTSFSANIIVYCNSKTGLLNTITKIISENNIDILGMKFIVNRKDDAVLSIDVSIEDRDQLSKLIVKLNNIPEIYDIKRG